MDTTMFGVRSERLGASAHLHLSGELDISSAPILERWLDEADGDGALAIVVDLQKLTFMDASGLHCFLRASDRASRSGCSFRIVDPPYVARRILEITKTTFLIDHPASPPRASARQSIDVAG